ncbi:MAG: methylamine dehydrogenase (amicyanin) light chain [Gammaproteobacteria bacterium]|nr:methylamine dehydrogenase (amicyanin) light chain [Gammaproteobacteria bacterium]
MNWLDRLAERCTRRVARNSSRRSFLALLGSALVGGAAVPLLPVARAADAGASGGTAADPGDPTKCDYWRNCAIDGYLCACCGGTVNTCPPGTEMSPITWIGTCRNPADGRDYIISYNDCCGKTSCGACLCQRNEGDRPVYRPHTANDYNWCLGTASAVYNCTVTVILGTAAPKS